jgi:hypothetical protein
VHPIRARGHERLGPGNLHDPLPLERQASDLVENVNNDPLCDTSAVFDAIQLVVELATGFGLLMENRVDEPEGANFARHAEGPFLLIEA